MGVVAVALDENVWWYTARASGMVAWALVATSVFWGLVVSGRLTRRLPPPAWNLDLHRFLGGLAVAFTFVHLAGLAADKYTNFGWSQLFVPFASTWRPAAVAWGITGMYLMAAIEVTSLLMRRLPRRLWRSVHASAFVLFVVATLHGLQAGTDAKAEVVVLSGLGFAVLALLAGVLRVVVPARRARRKSAAPAGPRQRTPAPASTAPRPRASTAARPRVRMRAAERE